MLITGTTTFHSHVHVLYISDSAYLLYCVWTWLLKPEVLVGEADQTKPCSTIQRQTDDERCSQLLGWHVSPTDSCNHSRWNTTITCVYWLIHNPTGQYTDPDMWQDRIAKFWPNPIESDRTSLSICNCYWLWFVELLLTQFLLINYILKCAVLTTE